ncbi:MAG: YitT family protein [Erysipelotrichaceae bacterium]|nr:YitT family protein [Erysipelotrichaceae bacterium]MDD3810541.1 YitT family protein [Erysipelotrichaceae bacterium]
MKKTMKILLGNLIMAVAVNKFIVANEILTGGVTGVALVVNHYLGLPVTVVVTIVNLAIFAWGWLVLGKSVARNTILSVIAFPALMELLNGIPGLDVPAMSPLEEGIIGGVLLAIGLALILKVDASTGGGDLVALIINRSTGISLALLVNALDAIILAAQVTFRPVSSIVSGLVLLGVMTVVLNFLLASNKLEAPNARLNNPSSTKDYDTGNVFTMPLQGYILIVRKQFMKLYLKNHRKWKQ